jgi:hypothetical protein
VSGQLSVPKTTKYLSFRKLSFGEVFVSEVWRVLVMCVGFPIAIRIEEKGEGFENGNCFFWRSGLAFNLNQSLQSLTRLKIFQNGYNIYETKI